jgi:hypothetical protein
MLYCQHMAFQKTITSIFIVFRLGCKIISFIYLFIYILFSSQQVLVDHPNLIGALNKIHKQQLWHVIDQDS